MENSLHISQALTGLILDGFTNDISRRGIKRSLSGYKDVAT